jgi:hypothetical protein
VVGEWAGYGQDRVSSVDGEVEPFEVLQLLLPDLSAITASRFRCVVDSSSADALAGVALAEGTNSAGTPVLASRDAHGLLVVSQTELLTVVWLPILLVNTKRVSPAYIGYALTMYLGALHSAGATAQPASCVLLVRLMAAQGNYLEVARLLQLQFFADGPEVALASLEMCDVLQLIDPPSYRRQLATIQTLQQASVDMLWRLDERYIIVRWLCGHGRVGLAMRLCQRRKGVWRRGLSPHTISGCEFFNGAVLVVTAQSSAKSPSFSSSHRRRKNKSKKGSSAGNDDACNFTCPYTRRLGLLHAVYRFLVAWDPTLLTVSAGGKSRLAAQASFPAASFRPKDELQLRGLFGFPVSEDLLSMVAGRPSGTV